ncbi:MAG TPA: hypothetical protein VM163_02770 [bacterium]|nr:hypothetical protein [bacterium]
MAKTFRSARTALLLLAMLLGLGLLASAQQAPQVLDCGVTPPLATYGDTVTFWANVASPETGGEVAVWIMYQFVLILELAETDTTESYTTLEGDWTVPNLPGIVLPGDYELFAVAISSSGQISVPAPFILSITDHDPRVPGLLSPPDGAAIYRGMPIPFEWGAVPEAMGYNFEIAFPGDATVSVVLPFFITSLVVNPELAAQLPDGEYRWRVQATFEDGDGDWADWFTFDKDSRHGPAMACQGAVTSVDVDEGVLRVESLVWGQDTDDPGFWGCWMVYVTDDTVIAKDGAAISLADVMLGNYVYVDGWASELGYEERCAGIVADRIEVTDSSTPSFVSGSVDEIIPEERSFWLSEMIYEAERPFERVLVRLTDEARLTRRGMSIEFEDVRVDDFAVASGSWHRAVDGDDYFVAHSVDFSLGDTDWVYFEGAIDRINYDNSTIVLSGTNSWGPMPLLLQGRVVVSVTRSTVISRNGLAASFNDLMVSDWALVEGRLMMRDQQPVPGNGELGAQVEASSIDSYAAYSARPGKS